MANSRLSQGGAIVVASDAAFSRLSQGGSLAVANIRGIQANASQGGTFTVADAEGANKSRLSQGGVFVIARGRTENPRLRAWTYSLDGHDYYVLRLGDNSTLVWDNYSGEWSEWSSGGGLDYWRASVGTNWLGAGEFSQNYGSSVLVGDDNFGLLWFLNPNQGFDNSPAPEVQPDDIPFERIVMGQIALRGIVGVKCDVIYLTADLGQPSWVGASVKLEVSDDAGFSFLDEGSIVITEDDFTQRVSWRSLGQMTAPGRLFKITDDGAFSSIFSMDMND